MKYYRTENGVLVNVIEHTIEELIVNPDLKVYVSTDSQNYGASTVYATVIVYRYGLRGAHYIYNKIKVPRIKDTFTRLYREGELTIECAEYIQKNSSVKIHAVEFDYNSRKITQSTNLVPVLKGWAESLGYKALVKPDEMIASKAADHLARC